MTANKTVTYKRNGWSLSKEKRKEIAIRYNNGEKPGDLGREFNVHRKFALVCARKCGFPIRNRWDSHGYPAVDHTAFSTITEESAYWIGFLMADGCVSNGRLSLGLCAEDKDHVEKFKKFLKTEYSTTITDCSRNRFPAQDRYSVMIRSAQIISDLAKYGITPRKSSTAKVIGLEFNRDFWRGVIEGDGYLTETHHQNPVSGNKRTYPRIGLVGSEFIITQFLEFSQSVVQYSKKNIGRFPDKKLFYLGHSGGKAISMIKFLYDGCSIFLDRKYKKAMELIERHGAVQ